MIIAGYLAALLIGLLLGMIGGGGSILTIPVLVYLFRLAPAEATGYSLFIVGISCLAGAYKYFRRGQIRVLTGFYFGVPSILTVLLVRKYILPAIPEIIYSSDTWVLNRSLLIMLVFAILMIVAAIQMLRNELHEETLMASHPVPVIKTIWRGIEVGLLTGLLGAGGGFIILPVLIFSFRLPMKEAVGTSLLIIAMNTLIGFLGDLSQGQQYHWQLLLTITLLSVVGTFAGRKWGEAFSGKQLKLYFGWFVLLMGITIIGIEFYRQLH
jgi:uncharacterized membrane protein YfcA